MISALHCESSMRCAARRNASIGPSFASLRSETEVDGKRVSLPSLGLGDATDSASRSQFSSSPSFVRSFSLSRFKVSCFCKSKRKCESAVPSFSSVLLLRLIKCRFRCSLRRAPLIKYFFFSLFFVRFSKGEKERREQNTNIIVDFASIFSSGRAFVRY